MEHKKDECGRNSGEDTLNHVGGVADDVGGVDPDVDKNLVRLSGGP
ncbi:hypothetical protein SDC9_171157 [bioreactor metagenome]|uniref:Uncharacterized protein n=1 Tax=bioreactor metagenome TaxID=1076179 RepID=A0A645GIQ0_9ZZZZ